MTYTIIVDCCGRPLTANKQRTVHFRVRAENDRLWREAGCVLARQAKVPRLSSVTVTAQGRYPTRNALPDCDGIHPALKATLDGVVDAGVLLDDKPPYVRSITYLAPTVAPGLPPALIVTLTETEETR